jgi:hyperosmotically inducible protein
MNRTAKTSTAILSLAAVALAAAMMVTACTSSTRTTESTGEYVDDATITSKVKAALVGDSGLSSFEIGVETYKDVVQLSGFVNSDQVKAHAGDVAAGVSGVISVQNNLVVK